MAQKMFKKLDVNEDGGIDASELGALAQEGQGPSAADILAKFDSDSDGVINEAENQAAMESAPPPPPSAMGTTDSGDMADLLSELMAKFDLDGDGSLSGTDSDELFSAIDADGDGSITKEEMSAHVASFTQTSATEASTTTATATASTSSLDALFAQMQRSMLFGLEGDSSRSTATAAA